MLFSSGINQQVDLARDRQRIHSRRNRWVWTSSLSLLQRLQMPKQSQSTPGEVRENAPSRATRSPLGRHPVGRQEGRQEESRGTSPDDGHVAHAAGTGGGGGGGASEEEEEPDRTRRRSSRRGGEGPSEEGRGRHMAPGKTGVRVCPLPFTGDAVADALRVMGLPCRLSSFVVFRPLTPRRLVALRCTFDLGGEGSSSPRSQESKRKSAQEIVEIHGPKCNHHHRTVPGAQDRKTLRTKPGTKELWPRRFHGEHACGTIAEIKLAGLTI